VKRYAKVLEVDGISEVIFDDTEIYSIEDWQ
jgi:hypothetical protein